jgi:ATP-binding cassette subfamily B protein
MRAAFAESRQEVGKINSTLENSIAGIRISKAYTNSKYEFDRFEHDNRGFVRARKRAYRSMGIFHSGMTLCMDILRITMYLAGGLFVVFGEIDIVVFTTFSLYITLFMSPIEKLVGFIEQYQNGMTGFKRFCDIIDEKPEAEMEGAATLENVKGDVEFENVTFGYNDSKQVLSDMSFRLQSGKTLALVGPSGGGKTTICHLIPRFYEVNSGKIMIDGQDITIVTRESLRRNIGIVSQDVFLFDSTIYDNIAYGNSDGIVYFTHKSNTDKIKNR